MGFLLYKDGNKPKSGKYFYELKICIYSEFISHLRIFK